MNTASPEVEPLPQRAPAKYEDRRMEMQPITDFVTCHYLPWFNRMPMGHLLKLDPVAYQTIDSRQNVLIAKGRIKSVDRFDKDTILSTALIERLNQPLGKSEMSSMWNPLSGIMSPRNPANIKTPKPVLKREKSVKANVVFVKGIEQFATRADKAEMILPFVRRVYKSYLDRNELTGKFIQENDRKAFVALYMKHRNKPDGAENEQNPILVTKLITYDTLASLEKKPRANIRPRPGRRRISPGL